MKTTKRSSKKLVRISKKTAPKAKSTRTDAFAGKLDAAKADTIRTRLAKGEKPTALASEYGCSFGAIRAVAEYRSHCPENIIPVAVPVATKTHAKLAAAAKKAGISIGEYLARLARHAVGEAAA